MPPLTHVPDKRDWFKFCYSVMLDLAASVENVASVASSRLSSKKKEIVKQPAANLYRGRLLVKRFSFCSLGTSQDVCAVSRLTKDPECQ